MSGQPRAKSSTVAEYVASLPPQSRAVLAKVRALVKKAVPGSRETISYGIPAFTLGRVFMYCAAFKSHIGIYPPVRGNAELAQKLKPYANAKGNLRFPLSDPVPYLLITQVAKALAKSYALKARTKSRKKGSRSGSAA